MVNAKAEIAQTPSQAQVDYDKVVNDKAYTDSAKNLGKSILKRLTSIGADTKIEELNGRIAKAAGENDVPLMKSLFAELNKLEQDQKNLKDQHKTIRGNNKFETVVQAWGSEIRELALSIAVEAIKSASAAQHQANAGGETGLTGKSKSAAAKANAVTTPPKTYIVTQEKTGKTAELPLRRGSAKPSKDKEVYELLGFKFNEDGSLTETGFKYKDKSGKQVVEAEATRKALLAAIENGGFAGFTAVLKG
ncbi:hypothetical protein [Pseudomonas syringae]|uniref:hypothetical protein n=1 Tax=Pseudomonas syringae TaxID=317 RepID=UPI001F42F7EE|nr:hypothetical protein [Pseudomonas syringae]MBL3827746.1 hypothetical protein [Pseudomonas syringae pv. theae]MBL3837170.1 hypothetical protein [Pseudomonas syringae pv. theae]GKQ45066.1 hypothetical protein PSTH2693_07940 [Pseudomonas syringae pv. theae]